MGYRRDISKPLQFIRALLLGRTWNEQNRFQDMLAPRPYPRPQLNAGSKVFENHYTFRDARRAVKPPQEIPVKLLGDGSKTAKVPPTPGQVYHWDVHNIK